MKPYAIIETGGKQYMVHAGDKLQAEKLEQPADAQVVFDKVLAISDGTSLKIGKPIVPDAKVTAKVVRQLRGKKVVSFKKKRRKGYTRKKGHRQSLTELIIETV